jgi:hypothetical protein
MNFLHKRSGAPFEQNVIVLVLMCEYDRRLLYWVEVLWFRVWFFKQVYERGDGMKSIMSIAILCGSCCIGVASETNLLVFSYSASLPSNAAYSDAGRGLNDGEWKASDIIRFDATVAVSLDLFVTTAVEQVSVLTENGVNSRTAAVTAEGSVDGSTWFSLGVLQAGSNGVFSTAIVYSRTRYLRITCQKDAAFAYKDLKEVIVSGRQAITITKKTFTYTPSQPACPYRADSVATPKLTDGIFNSAQSGVVQYGPQDNAALTSNAGNPAYAVATNLALVLNFGGTSAVEGLTRVSLYAHSPTNNGNWGTESIIVSNSVNGVDWQLTAVQTNFTVLPGDVYGVIRRFDVLLPYTTSRYVTVVAKKPTKSTILRQLLAEVEVSASVLQTGSPAGDPIAYTYTVDKPSQMSNESTYAPKLTDGVYEHVTRHALRYYEAAVTVTADLKYPQYIHSGFAYTWGAPTKYSATNAFDYYGTQRVDCYGSLDGATWTFFGSLTGKVLGQKTNTFTQLPYCRYVKATFVRADPSGDFEVSSQIIGELTFYGLPKQSIGSVMEISNAIPFAGFETTPLLDAATLVRGGSTNGWTFSALDTSNYTGFQINGSPVSTNVISLAKFVAPEGVQTAVMRGTNVYMETLITVPQTGSYLLKLQANSLAFNEGTELSGYNLNVGVDGVNKGLVDIQTLSFAQHAVYLGRLEAGTHTLRFSAVNARNSPAGALIDDLKLLRIPELSEIEGTAVRKAQSIIMPSTEPLALNYIGKFYIRNLVVDGQRLQHSVYSADTTPSLFSGFGSLHFEDGLSVLIK